MLHTYLDLSTEHLSQDTLRTILGLPKPMKQDLGWPAMSIAPYNEGVFMTVPAREFSENLGRLPMDLEVVLLFCQSLGVTVVRFDADGVHCSQLPTYEWN